MYETALSLLSVSAPLTTYLLFISPIPTLYNALKQGTVDALSPMPFLTNILCGGLWFSYGMYKNEATVVNVNAVNLVLQGLYVLVYAAACRSKGSFLLKTSATITILVALVYHALTLPNDADVLNQLGTAAAVANVLAIGSPLAALGDVISSRSTANLPFPMIAFGFIVTIQWFLFGLIINDLFMQVPNGLGIILGVIQLSLFAIYPSEPAAKKED